MTDSQATVSRFVPSPPFAGNGGRVLNPPPHPGPLPRGRGRGDRKFRSRGFTIIELFAVLAIISVLLALILPAVQQARESARRIDCEQHLKQIGLALHNYESSHRVYPPGVLLGGWSFYSMILPELGFQPTYKQINFANNVQWPQGYYHCTPETKRMSSLFPEWNHVGPLLHCPSDPFRQYPWLTNYIGNSGNGGGINYGGDFYPGTPLPITIQGDGMLYFCSSVRPGEVLDGASQTLFVGERAKSRYGGVENALCGGSGMGFSVVGAGELRPGSVDGAEDHYHFWSYHYGGAQFVFVDGHVRLLNYSMDRALFFALATRAGKETVGEF